MTQAKIKVTIVTVCLNAAKTIEKTICSVLKQTYREYEYILVDGQSSDETNDIIKRYIPQFESKGICFKYVSEKDKGIYDAMNKAVDMAEGEWIAFMNADDSYYDENVLKRVFTADEYETVDILYGSTNFIFNTRQEIQEPLEVDVLRDRAAFAHQSAFIRTQYMRQEHFDSTLRLAADYKFFLEAWLTHKNFRELEGIVVSNFSEQGLSTTAQYYSLAEHRKIRYQHKIPGRNRFRNYCEYLWWVAVHLGGRRKGRHRLE